MLLYIILKSCAQFAEYQLFLFD